MNQTVLPQLQSVEAELSSQESQIAEQLASLREKLESIRAVMPMFSGDAEGGSQLDAVPAVEAPAVETSDNSDKSEPDKAKAATSKQTVQKKNATAKKTTAKKATTKRATTKRATTKKKDGRTATWQKYTRPGVDNASIPDAVRLILETQPKNEFKIAEVMDALFKENMPKAQYLKARNRISNVLSGGVRAGDWFKGDRGTYRMTKA